MASKTRFLVCPFLLGKIKEKMNSKCLSPLSIPQKFTYPEDFPLACGETLQGFSLVYETYGQLKPDKSNAIFICPALSASHHAAGASDPENPQASLGWWDHYIGPGKPIDTNLFFVVCCSNLGSCFGSTGPLALNPQTGKTFGKSFPLVTVSDFIESQRLLKSHLGIDKLFAIIGGSLGGMQAMYWSARYPEEIQVCVAIASAPWLNAQNIGFNEIARQMLALSSPVNSHEQEQSNGMAIARMLGHITYLSEQVMGDKFGRETTGAEQFSKEDAIFQVESYLRYQGLKFTKQFDAYSYYLMTKALDLFDLRDGYASLEESLARCKASFLLISFTGDWRFSARRSLEIATALMNAKKRVSHINIDSDYGHDAFLLPNSYYEAVLGTYLKVQFKNA